MEFVWSPDGKRWRLPAAWPRAALTNLGGYSAEVAGSASRHMQEDLPTRDAATTSPLEAIHEAPCSRAGRQRFPLCGKRFTGTMIRHRPARYRQKAPVMFINSRGTTSLNPPEMGVAEREIRKVKREQSSCCYLPPRRDTQSTAHTHAAVWRQCRKRVARGISALDRFDRPTPSSPLLEYHGARPQRSRTNPHDVIHT